LKRKYFGFLGTLLLPLQNIYNNCPKFNMFQQLLQPTQGQKGPGKGGQSKFKFWEVKGVRVSLEVKGVRVSLNFENGDALQGRGGTVYETFSVAQMLQILSAESSIGLVGMLW
jgi:hypothetical protein